MYFLPEFDVLMAYSLACLVLFATPGPDMSLFLSRTISGGRQAGIAALLGASFGSLIHTLLATLGLSAILAASPKAFFFVKSIGALYLAWLALDAIRNGSALNVKQDIKQQTPFWRTFWTGVGINLSNPKVVLFFVTFLPQFISASDPHAAQKLAFLGIYFLILTVPLCILMVLGAERVVEGLKQRPGIMRAIDYAFAGIFGAFAVKILLSETK